MHAPPCINLARVHRLTCGGSIIDLCISKEVLSTFCDGWWQQACAGIWLMQALAGKSASSRCGSQGASITTGGLQSLAACALLNGQIVHLSLTTEWCQ